MLSLGERLMQMINTRLPNQPRTVGGSHAAVVVFSSANPDVGDIEIYDDGEELTVLVGKFTHTHFGNYDTTLSSQQRVERIAEDVVSFLEDVFADRIEFFGSHIGAGGFRRREHPRGLLSKLIFGRKTYVWSGPVRNDG